jgi:ribonuclease VapC
VILDTSSIAAIVFKEPDAAHYNAAMAGASSLCMSAATLVEATTVLEGRSGSAAGVLMEDMLTRLGVEICPVTERTARIAQSGWRRFGKGRHPAALNLGDCFAYALAVERDEPLLFKGDDFARTDVKRAL